MKNIIGAGRLLKLISKETVRSAGFRFGRLCAALVLPVLVIRFVFRSLVP